jgi:hypothetical protein
MACTPVLPDFCLEHDILLKLNGLINEHGEGLILKEEVLFFGTKNTAGVWVLAGSEFTGLNGTAVTTCHKDLGERGQEVVLNEGDWDLGGTIECGDVVVVGVQDPTRAGVDANEGSIACGGVTSLNEVADKVVDGHDDGGVVDFSDGGGVAANVGDLLNELFSGVLEIVVDGFGDRLQIEWGDREHG